MSLIQQPRALAFEPMGVEAQAFKNDGPLSMRRCSLYRSEAAKCYWEYSATNEPNYGERASFGQTQSLYPRSESIEARKKLGRGMVLAMETAIRMMKGEDLEKGTTMAMLAQGKLL